MNFILQPKYFLIPVLIFFSFLKVYASDNKFSKNENLVEAQKLVKQNKVLSFTENKGQMVDMNGNPVPYVMYKAEANNFIFWITDKGLTYQFLKFEEKEVEIEKEKVQEIQEIEWARVDMILKNASIFKENIITENRVEQGFDNYFLGHCSKGVKNVYSYKKITVKNIYKDIDWVLYSNEGFAGSSLKQDFIVHPNADVNQIKLIYEGIGDFNIENNQIHFSNGLGELFEGSLLCYQNSISNKISSEYLLKENKDLLYLGNGSNKNKSDEKHFSYEVNVKVSNYNKNEILVIDPQLVWSTFYGAATGLEGPTCITSDNIGNIFIGGYCSSTDFPLQTNGAFYQGVFGGGNGTFENHDAFILKFNNNGVRQWATYYGGNGQDNIQAVETDLNNNVFFVGFTSSSNLTLMNGGAGTYNQTTFMQGTGGATGTDGFILKFDNNGNYLWGTYYGGSSSDYPTGVDTDRNGNVFVVGYTGYTSASDFPLQNSGTYYFGTTTTWGNAFILKFNNIGVRQWATFYGASDGSTKAHAVAVDPFGNIFVTGNTSAPSMPTQNAGGFFQAALANGQIVATDIIVLKFDNLGNRLWATFYGGSQSETGNAIACDAAGNVFVAGSTSSNDLPTQNAGSGTFFQGAFAGGTGGYPKDGLIIKFDNATARQWATYVGGSANDYDDSYVVYDGLEVDKCGNVYLGFETLSTNITTKAHCLPNSYLDNTPFVNGSYGELIYFQFSNTGILNWATYFGGSGRDHRVAIAIDPNDNLFITGEWTLGPPGTSYFTVNPGGGAYFNAAFSGGNDDGFIQKFLNPKATIATSQVNLVPCGPNNGSATVTVNGGCSPYYYTWSTGANNLGTTATSDSITGLGAGTYWVVVNNEACLANSDTVFFTITGGGSSVIISQSPTICTGQSFTRPGGGIVTTAGTYIDTLQTWNGCDSIITTNIAVVNAITSSQSPTICAGQNFTRPGGGIINISGTYIDTLTSTGGCDSIITTNLTVTPALSSTQNPTICTGQSFTRPGGTVVNVAGTYIDTIPSVAGCDSIITTTLTLVSALTSAQSAVLCIGQTYTRPNGSIVSTAGVYVDTINSSGGCDSIITTTLSFNANSTSTQNPIICANNTYTLPGGAVVNASGIYVDTLLNYNGCDSIITTTLTVNQLPISSITGNTTLLPGESSTLIASGGGSYNWYPSTGLNVTTGNTVVATPSQTTVYCVVISDSNGCKDTSCVTLNIEIPCSQVENLDVPNAFSPNADGINDDFCLQGWDGCIETFSILIFDRWGEKVFESKDPNFCWDGKFKGVIMDAQVFIYYIKAVYINSSVVHTKKGNISLIK